jgi:uncharacterized membrane protein YeaQ/YmgE (transglycosylase-associated protein family)
MIEIIILVQFCKKLAAIAREKNRSGSWGAVGAVGWIGGEITGAVVGASGGSEGMNLYGVAILGAIVGAILAYVIVKSLKELPTNPDFPSARAL